MKKSRADDVIESPIAFTPGSNGELAPIPATDDDRRATELFRQIVDANARRSGVSRRDFVRSSCGTAAALFVRRGMDRLDPVEVLKTREGSG